MCTWKFRAPAVGAVVGMLAVATALAPARAVRLFGSSSTAAYSQEVENLNGTTIDLVNRTTVFERLRFDVMDLPTADLSFHGFLTARNGATNLDLKDTKTRLYSGYLQFHPLPSDPNVFRCDLRLGRQWVTAGVGSGTVDGMFAQFDRPGWGGVTLFGGTLGIDEREQLRVDSWKDSRRLGGEARIHPHISDAADPEVAVSYAVTHRNDLIDSQRLGARGSLTIRRRLRVWSEVRHDFLLNLTYGTASGIEFQNPSNGLRVWADYNQRKNDLPASSFFAYFDQQPIDDLRGGLGVPIGGPYRMNVDFGRTDAHALPGSDLKVDRGTSYRLYLQRGGAQIGGRLQRGFGGDQTGLVASVNQDVNDRLNVNIDLGYESYNYGPTEIEDNNVSSGIVAATYRLFHATRVTGQIEAMKNRDLKQDVRFLARIDQRFQLGH